MRAKKETNKEIVFMGKYQITSDPLNIIVQEKKTITGEGRGRPTQREVGEEYWNNIAFFSTPKGALNYIIEKEIRESWVDDLKEVVKCMDSLYKAIQELKLDLVPDNPQVL